MHFFTPQVGYHSPRMSDDFPVESRFSIEAAVGRGAAGEILRGIDRATGRPVAVKRLHARHDEEPSQVERFRREARLLAQIDDPHVVRYVAHGADRLGRPCLVVEWLDGEDVARRQRRQRLTVAEALDVARQAALGLDALHRAGIVHRDVKPSNLFAVPNADGSTTIKLIDLGIARAAGEATLTAFGSMLGTPFYMSPEQARGEERVTARADLFSLGAVLFELLSGRRAFPGDEIFAVIAKIVLAEPLALREVMPGAPPLADALLRRALRKAPEERFASAREMAGAIAAVPPWTPGDAITDGDDDDDAPTRIAPLSSAVERRVVTAVFAGFSHASWEEDLHAFGAIAAEQGGAVHATLGRRAVAVFGGARSTGDEAVRAARTALAAVDRTNGIRIVIATGRALSGVTGLSGDIVDRGVRAVEGAAGPPPSVRAPAPVRLDDATADLLGELFAVEGPPGGRVLLGVRRGAAPPRKLLGKPTPCVGRERELGLLAAMFEECAAEPIARAALVTGAAGIGKSRLRFELAARLAAHGAAPEVIVARGSPLGEPSAFGLLAPALRRLAGVLGGEPPAEQRRKLRERIGRRAPAHAADILADMAHVPGVEAAGHGDGPRPDAMVSGDRLRGAWIAWLDAETIERPIVLVLEDLHRADLPTIAFVDAALRALPDRPLFVVAFARPEVHERFPQLWAGRGSQEVRLGPLTPRSAERLVRAALGDQVGRDAVLRIVGRGEGNAFYLEELIRAEAEGTGAVVPDTVLGMVQARLDALGAGAKRALRAASVFGEVFWRGGVAALAGDAGGALEQLDEAELISPRPGSALTGEDELAFRNVLVREAAYAMIPDAELRAAHRLAGAWLERAGEVDPVLLATHFERGGDRERAAGHFLHAALSALAGNDFAGAITHAERSVSLGDAEGDAGSKRRGRARLVQAEALRWKGDVGAAAVAAADAVALLPRGSPAWFHAARESIAAHGRLGQFDRVEALAEQLLAQDAFDGAAGPRVAALLPACGHLVYAGKNEAAARLLERIEGLAAAPAGLDPEVLARLQQLRALFADRAGDMEAALAHHGAALDAFERAGDARGACQSLANVGFIQLSLGSFTGAEAALRAAHAGAERMGLGTASALALHNLGGVLAALGRLDEAYDVEERAVRAFAAAGDPRLEGASRLYLSRILISRGDLDGAEAEARRVAESPASPAPLRAGARAALSLALLAAGRAEEALAFAREAGRALAELGSVEDFEVLIGIAHAEALDATGDHEAAKSVIAAARRDLLARADRLAEPARTQFLEVVPDNARCLGLAAAWAIAP